MSLLDSTKSYDAILVYRRNLKAPLMILSSSGNENYLMTVINEDPAQIMTIIEEVKSLLKLDIIDLDDKDKDDKIPLREMLSRVKISNIALLSNPTPIYFAKHRLELIDEDLEDDQF